MMNLQVDEYVSEAKQWQEEMEKLRTIILDCGLSEEFKWRKPCYTYEGNNLVIIQPFKDYLALMFFKGVLLKDPNNILKKPGENSQTQRQIRFTNTQEITEMESILKAYIVEAIEVEKSGLKVDFKEKKEIIYPEELQTKFDEIPELKTAFEKLTPGRQRAYIIHFTQAKLSKTRMSRIEKYMPQILNGKGLND